jgi:DNA helicase II / ATP-dependent DNA helicase PcrA
VQVSRPMYAGHRPIASAPEPQAAGLSLGQRVRHDTFGEGVVVDFEGSGSHVRVQVNFETSGQKWLVLAYAKLVPVA